MRFGGDDTKWDVSANGIYHITINTFLETIKAEVLTNNARLNDVTAVGTPQTSTVVTAGRGCIIISLPEERQVSVVSASGATVASFKAKRRTVTGLHPGLYVVKAGSEIRKVVVLPGA